MNKLIVIAAIALAGTPALASKARVGALGNSRQLVDVQYVFERPYLLHSIGEMATIEWGASQSFVAATPHAEGGFFKKSGDDVYGIYFGRKSDTFNLASLAIANGLVDLALTEQNPINFLYGSKTGDLSWGANFKYSNGKIEGAAEKKSSTMGFSAGVTNGTWQAELVMGLGGKASIGANEIESKSNYTLGFGYNVSDAMHAYLKTTGTKADEKGAQEKTAFEAAGTEVGFINTLVKNDDVNFFYGAKYSMVEFKEVDAFITTITTLGGAPVKKAKMTTLPVSIGIEANATSWMTLRASAQQSVLINETDEAGAKSDKDSVEFNVGAGIKLNKGMLDVTFNKVSAAGAAQNAGLGQFNYAADGFLTNASYTYSF